MKYFQEKKYISTFGEKILVPFKLTKQNLLKNNNLKYEDIIITGNPYFDLLYSHKIRKISINPKYKKLLFLSQPLKNQEKYIEEMLRILKRNKEYFLILKFHPNEDIFQYKEIYKKYIDIKKRILMVKDKYSSYDCIENSDYIISRNSSTLIEANLLGKMIIGEINENYSIKELNIGIEYNSYVEIEHCIKYLEKNYYKIYMIEKNCNASLKIKKEILHYLKI